ncbi:D-alanyl-D-alanine carboxypeptidase/D-alanyl-D-alanine-endopeptidase [Gordonia sp. ABSL1-1]|uniref:D-alanyl-D-alanine carboxypeptidase/D-alanyl-D-alanine endopeptidase n=1 Tax=Gordonia sp. ABSL1-1 TaxID=3053923 RepID=UPI0025745300|nr:D-alanyl-D-alanine carboxypeptidase/D-alanyl-D-alanine-endopeptidase [Gordonia sp. ABSL1-1]MDL9938592.1 D-alanyl-D-alanine carboxypeptidase/D-alanyl-D-alanine-endopeptidase [Gordonia sp. ABSL1-1]
MALALVAVCVVVVALRIDDDPEPPLPAGIGPQPAPIVVAPDISPVADTAPVPTPAGVRKEIAARLRNPALGELTGQISDSITGEVLWSKGATTPRIPASNDKVLSAAAYLLALPHDQRLTTTVVTGTGGQVILKGAGDPTLSAQPPGADTFYTEPARISDLAAQIKASGIPVTSVAVDLSAYDGPDYDTTWDRRDIAGGDLAPIQPVMADGARIDPLDEFSPRHERPAIAAGEALAAALGVDGDVTEATAPATARVVAKVSSAPLVTRVNDMLRYSDNVLAETLSIELSTHLGGPATLDGGVDAIVATLSKTFAAQWKGTTLHDASGISYANRVPAALLDAVMGAASGPGQPTMRPMLDGLPIAGGTGTLADRFDPTTNPGAGWVRAKTGTLTGVSSLTGIVQTVDGRVLSFAMMSGGTSPADARPALDAVIGELRECGCR